ncbi:GNAT family N-acetyltransferase [Nocardioides sp. KR10-350]|uniref:GNAT family N-acetyltransferase n=1 Tax=Nocardioides cheoyonin TaxID=3156615 RepID=UPI0032B5D543
MSVEVRPAQASDAEWLASAYDADWEGPSMTLDGVDIPLLGLPTLVAEDDGELCGYLVHDVSDTPDEPTTLLAMAAHPQRQGTGRALIEAFLERHPGPVRVVTTNDNLAAVAFYQKCGFRITGVRSGAVDRSREVKPAIPLVGEGGIPIHDELVLERHPEA